ncbi:peptidase inhibitor family I36 protein [Streptomyces sp. NBC_01363]|uniref:peptidase inhibitor family I36 protein n=1 Tax=Streptomyces sp. NBC_01363 TaxID=2903840 RepID=UPI0022522B79|nr:peptidase inhibitor family I36 protein [Streptomyces sp. NBC_01363]MCX4729908.1 peptidase inhibitor family I36 protein [Streptomyces sp. NBC_01363]
MTTSFQRPSSLARVAASAAAAVVIVLFPGTTTADAAAHHLPPGVVELQDSEPCPPATLCLYRDYNNRGPAYGIGAGHHVDLRDLPMSGGVNGPTAADEVSSWVNNTNHLAVLIDTDEETIRPLFPQQSLQEPPQTNDTVDIVRWV